MATKRSSLEQFDIDNESCKRCHKHAAKKLHPCPYDADVYNNSKSKCNCCDACMRECAADV